MDGINNRLAVRSYVVDTLIGLAPVWDLSSMITNEQKDYLRSYCDANLLSEYTYAVWDLYMKLVVAKPSPG